MYGLKVRINDNPCIVGGADDLSVLSAILTCSGKLGDATNPPSGDDTQEFMFRLGGLTSRIDGATDEHLVWVENHDLKLGDKVIIEIVDVDIADSIISGEEAKERAYNEQTYFEHCKRAYFELREKYELES
ncbi:hypothetical protein [Undibacterium flavidum]|jgi:hypothetical protein|uniref:Uncharacterized protein n=1 Tax=Undibacterium flavidum TaxID=2762297 RepID=A0ABR6Y8W6_9BURK|nr:hypothetical protein [Undibacterium flavidum]MBC3873023.1 hypothetical protein [Undibacterium flavidum]